MIRPSLPKRPTAVAAITILCGEIILPAVLPALPADAMRISDRFSPCAVITCNMPTKALEEVLLPVRKTPKVPIIGLMNGYKV